MAHRHSLFARPGPRSLLSMAVALCLFLKVAAGRSWTFHIGTFFGTSPSHICNVPYLSREMSPNFAQAGDGVFLVDIVFPSFSLSFWRSLFHSS